MEGRIVRQAGAVIGIVQVTRKVYFPRRRATTARDELRINRSIAGSIDCADATTVEPKTNQLSRGDTREALMRWVLSAAEARLCGGSPSRKLYPPAGSFSLPCGTKAILRRTGSRTGSESPDFLARVEQDRQPRRALAQKWPSLLTVFERSPTSSELCLRRRKQRVFVRSPAAAEASLHHEPGERRAHIPTLTGLGTRESLPTLFDTETPLPPTARPRVHAICELDTVANEQLLLEAERLSLCFEWDKD